MNSSQSHDYEPPFEAPAPFAELPEFPLEAPPAGAAPAAAPEFPLEAPPAAPPVLFFDIPVAEEPPEEEAVEFEVELEPEVDESLLPEVLGGITSMVLPRSEGSRTIWLSVHSIFEPSGRSRVTRTRTRQRLGVVSEFASSDQR
jgi:hypothetical protein